MSLPVDVKPNSWDSTAIQHMLSIGAMGTYENGVFNDGWNITRGQAAVLGHAVLGQVHTMLSAHAVSGNPSIMQQIQQYTLMVMVYATQTDQHAWCGAAVWVDPDTILTARHVVTSDAIHRTPIDPTRIHLTTYDGKTITGQSDWTITLDDSNDRAIIHAPGTGGLHLDFSDPVLGSDAWSCGYPNFHPFYVSHGTVADTGKDAHQLFEGNSFFVSILAYEGNSGGPVFNADGNLIGIIVASDTDTFDSGAVKIWNYMTYVLPAWRG